MSKQRRRYDDSFKREAVNLSIQSTKPVREIAEELGISKELLYRWRAKFEKDDSTQTTVQNSQSELLRVKKELAETQLERDILKKALGIFSKAPK